MLSREDLHDYQLKAIKFATDNPRCGLFLDMGLGKSVSTLTLICDLIDSYEISKVLVVAPLRVANSVWKQEVSKWAHLGGLKVQICTGNERARLAALATSADVYVINRENVVWLYERYGSEWPFDMLVVDESSSFKSHSAKRFKAIKKVLHLIDRVVLLTGTPAPNGLTGLWSQMYMIDFGERLGRTVTNFRRRFFNADPYVPHKWAVKPSSDKKIHELISDKVMSMSADDYLDLPDRVDVSVIVELSAVVMKQYLKLENQLLLEYAFGEVIEAANAAVLAGKLFQLCNGAMYVDEAKNWYEFHTSKLDALADLIEDNAGENLLVAYNFKSDLERLRKRFPQGEVLTKSGDAIDRWNSGEIPLLFAHPASAGHGLNLQHGGCIVVWFSLTWSLELYQQFNARLHRQGQGRPVRVIHIVVKDALDERVMSVISDKSAVQNELLSALKR